MKLNPMKCTFGMQEGMFLGYKVSTNGLRACSEKADAVLSLPSPRYIKDVQKLNGKLASLNRFLSKSAEKSQIKKLIAELPTLTAPRENEELIIYLAATKEAISAVLMTDREGKQIPVYFVSRTLRGPEVNYTPMEKLVLALLSAKKRLKRYFQAHTVVVITNQPIKQLLSCSEISGRMLKWKFELEGYDIQYRPRTAIKGQILADFIVERLEEESPDELMAEPEVLVEELKEKSINEKEILDVVEEEGNTWMTPICEYMTKEILPEDKKKARVVRRKAASMHFGPRSVVAKVIRTGYYWITMHIDAWNLIRECNDYQIHHPVPRNPQQNLTPITSPWPFYK
ncbi:reverse transcriptase domain-containing protein [Tanacetum coccineum]